MTDAAYLAADADDRRAALEAATTLAACQPDFPWIDRHDDWLTLAGHAYRWLRARDSLRAVSVELVPGTPHPEGTIMATTFDLSDTDSVTFTLTGLDAKGAAVPAPSDTWSWSLADPDSSGAQLAVSADTLSATVSAGVPDTNLLLTVSGQSTGITGAEAIVVQATAAVTVGLVPGTPVAEPPAAPSA